jgi:hypothetical protein
VKPIAADYNGMRPDVVPEHAMATTTPTRPPEADLERRFAGLVHDWKAGRSVTSSSREMARHPAYEAIVGLGPSVVPLILRELEREPEHWFIALRSLTGIDPVPPEHRGDVGRMAADWVDWGRANGLRW